MVTPTYTIPMDRLFANNQMNLDDESARIRQEEMLRAENAREQLLGMANTPMSFSNLNAFVPAVVENAQFTPDAEPYSALRTNQPQSIVGGMFSPEISRAAEMDYMMKRQRAMQDEALAYAQLTPMQQAQFGFYRGGQQLGDVLGGALGGQDPQLQLISQRQQMLSMIDPDKPETFARAIQMALQTGDRNTALMLNDEMKNAQARKTENLQLGLQRLARNLYKADGSIDEQVYNTLQGYGAVGQAVIDQQFKGFQNLQTQKAQVLGRQLFNADGTPNLAIVAELRKTPEGRKILEENAPKTMTVKGDETIMSVPVLGETPKVIQQGQKVEPFTGTMANAANFLYQTTDPKKIFSTYGQAGLDKVSQKAEELSTRERPVTNINVSNQMQKGFGENLTDTITSNIKAGSSARPILSAVDSMQILLDEGVKTGFGQETMLQVGRVGQVFNPDFNIKGLAGQEALQSISTNLVLPQVKQLGVNPTDTDLKFINTGSPSLSKTVAGNKLMLSALRLKAERDQDLARFTNTWLSQNTKLTTTNPTQAYVKFNTDFDAYTQSSPLYAPSANRLREQFNALGSSGQPRTGQPNARDTLNRGGLTKP
jgi:hypothetical protein